MNCEILQTLYVRSNGEVSCDDDAGEVILLGSLPPQGDGWSPTSLFSNKFYTHIRESLRQGKVPWPDVCPRCAFFRGDDAFADSLALRSIRKLQVEPSLACRLRCPGCSNQVQVRRRGPPLLMRFEVFTHLLGGLHREGFSITEIEYCGQGEPLLHPRFPDFVRIARTYFPMACQRLITSGNFDFRAATGGAPLDEIFVSCDGFYPESYARYRVGGRVELPLRFMHAARGVTGARIPTVIWKYILFEWNDTPEELFAAHRAAQIIGVHTLLFVYTHSAGKSRRYTMENPDDLPVGGPNVHTNATPIHYQSPNSRAYSTHHAGHSAHQLQSELGHGQLPTS